jgi:hypothetical protein
VTDVSPTDNVCIEVLSCSLTIETLELAAKNVDTIVSRINTFGFPPLVGCLHTAD